MYNQTQASTFPSLCPNIIDLWKGFGYNDLTTSTIVNDRNITVPYPVKDINKYNSMKPYVDKYYNYLSLIEAQPGDAIADAHAKEFTWDSANHTLKYVNDNASTHHVECSNAACTPAVFKTASKNHKHKDAYGNLVNNQDQCDLCGYRKGIILRSWNSFNPAPTPTSDPRPLSTTSGEFKYLHYTDSKTGIEWYFDGVKIQDGYYWAYKPSHPMQHQSDAPNYHENDTSFVGRFVDGRTMTGLWLKIGDHVFTSGDNQLIRIWCYPSAPVNGSPLNYYDHTYAELLNGCYCPAYNNPPYWIGFGFVGYFVGSARIDEFIIYS